MFRLEPLQGRCIPRFFGEATSDNRTPSIVLEYVEGIPLHQLPLEELASRPLLEALDRGESLQDFDLDAIPKPDLLAAIQHTYHQLTKNGVVHGDPELHNFIRVDGCGVVAVDFEFAHLLPHDVTNQHELEALKDKISGKAAPLKKDKVYNQGPIIPMSKWAKIVASRQ